MAAMRASLDRSPLPVPHPTRRAHPCRRRHGARKRFSVNVAAHAIERRARV